MNIYSWIIENKELLKIVYGLIIALISFFIVLKVHKLFKISLHQGIRYFRNAFLFFGFGFIFRYLFGTPYLYNHVDGSYFLLFRFLMEFSLIMAGFFLLYSLIWKKIENQKENPLSSLLNPRIAIFYSFSFLIVVLDIIWKTYFFMFASQIIVFVFATIISLRNYNQSKNKHNFLKFYLIAMVLSLLAWILNALAASLLNWDYIIIILVSLINVLIFFLFLYGIIKSTGAK